MLENGTIVVGTDRVTELSRLECAVLRDVTTCLTAA
jgi:hypothetical protein